MLSGYLLLAVGIIESKAILSLIQLNEVLKTNSFRYAIRWQCISMPHSATLLLIFYLIHINFREKCCDVILIKSSFTDNCLIPSVAISCIDFFPFDYFCAESNVHLCKKSTNYWKCVRIIPIYYISVVSMIYLNDDYQTLRLLNLFYFYHER